jgi:hypothetical protein
MNYALQFQELDDLIVANTKPPVTAILRNKVYFIRDQLDAELARKFPIIHPAPIQEQNQASIEANSTQTAPKHLQKEAVELLQYFFTQQEPRTVDEAIPALPFLIAKDIVQGYCDALLAKDFIKAAVNRGFVVTSKGREFMRSQL